MRLLLNIDKMWSILVLSFVVYSCTNNFLSITANNIYEIDATKTLVWGPGLDPENITLRARYIFLQLVNNDGQNLTESPEYIAESPNILSFEISGETQSNKPCHIWHQIFDCKDGSFIIRYRIYNTCFNLKISIKVKNQVLPLQHSIFKGPIYEEECYCPNPSVQLWLNNNNCNQNDSQILQDLKLFPDVDFNDLRSKMIAKYGDSKSMSVCNYVIKSNKVFRKCYGEHVGFKSFVDEILLSLTRKTVLPDVEFFTNLGDFPLVPKNKEIFPMFSWCGSKNFHDIVFPTYDITKSSIEAMGSVMMDMLSVQGKTKLPWNKKIKKVFWRGRDSRRERLNLINIARKHPDIFNASITNFFFFKNEIDKYGPGQKHISFFDFFEYKYQLNIDGTVAAYRFPYLLVGDSLVFKQNSEYYEHFYKDVTAGKHFVSVKKDLSDLIDKVKWAMNNDNEAYKITREARQYARSNLMPQNIFCYHVALIQEWSKRLRSTIEVLPGMEEVPQPEHKCECITSDKRKKDEL